MNMPKVAQPQSTGWADFSSAGPVHSDDAKAQDNSWFDFVDGL